MENLRPGGDGLGGGEGSLGSAIDVPETKPRCLAITSKIEGNCYLGLWSCAYRCLLGSVGLT